MRGHKVAGNKLPPSNSKRLDLVFLPVRRVFHQGGCGRGGGRLKPVHPFLSLLHVKVQESPPILCLLHFGPWGFNFIYDADFWYMRFLFSSIGSFD